MDDISEYVASFCKKELIYLYDIKRRVFEAWMRDTEKIIGKEKGRMYTPKQIEVMFTIHGVPPMLRALKKKGYLDEYLRKRIVKPGWLDENSGKAA